MKILSRIYFRNNNKENIAYIYTVKEKQKSYVPDLEKLEKKL